MTHDELAESLASHLRAATDTMVWTDLACGPVGSPRPDVIALDKSFRLKIRAYEVKVARADFLADVGSGKWRAYLAVAESVTFACVPGLIAPSELPAGVGLICLRPDGTWHGLRRAKPQPQPQPDHRFWLKLLMDGLKFESARLCRPERVRPIMLEWERTELLRARNGAEIAEALANRDRLARRVADETARLSAEAERLAAARAARAARDDADAAALRDGARAVVAAAAVALGLPETACLAELQHAVWRLTGGAARIDAAQVALDGVDRALATLRQTRARLTGEGG